ncbi:3865_t:CDS:2 [Paraglomus brasilianum]|uniref:3865_t:CDS:1 n=1 Tax=Paraglomus brasilianum TaxID=144538 RepID=A0A9N9CBJ5_9GLOM|nr:3865_t:CDS:2 [Paraglomus brasilianum]
MSRLKSSSTFTIHSTVISSSSLHHLSLFFFLLLVFLPPLPFTYAQSALGQPTSDISWRAGHSACIISNYMVLFGGVTSSSVDFFTTSAATNDVVVWGISDQRWYKPGITAVAGSAVPLPQKFVPCVSLSGKMFVLIANSTDQSVAKDIAVLDGTFWNWQDSITTSPPPDFRVGATLTAVNDTLYRYAGQQASPTGNPMAGINNLLYSLDSKTLVWTSRANGPSLAYHTACYLPKFDIIALFGGQNTDSQPQDVLTTYSVTKGVWNQFVTTTSQTKPSARLGHSAVCTEDKMIVFGGGTISSNGGTASDSSVWLATATSETSFSWSTPVTNQTNSPSSRMGHSAVLSGNNMIVFGGIGSAINDKTVYILDTNTWTWSSVSPGGNPSSSSQTAPAASGSGTSATSIAGSTTSGTTGQKKSLTVIIAAAVGGFVGVIFMAIAIFATTRHYRRKNRKLQFDDDEMSEVDSALGGNSTDMSPPPRSREVVLSSPVAARLANKDTVFNVETLPRLQQLDGIDKRESIIAPEAARAAPLNPWNRSNGPRGHYVRGSTDSFGNWRSKSETGEEEEADRWTFASSFSYDREREKDQLRDGSTPPIRYMPQRMDSVGSLSSTFGQRGGHTFPYHHGHSAHASHPWMQSRGDDDDPHQSVPLAMPVVQPEVIVTAPRVPPNVAPTDYNVGSGLNSQQYGNSNSSGGGHIRATTVSGLGDNQVSLNDTLSPLDRIARLFSGGDVSGAIGIGEKETVMYPQNTQHSTNEDTNSVRGQSIFIAPAVEDTNSNSGNNAIYNANSLHQSAEDVSHVKDAVSLRGTISVASVKELAAAHSSVARDEKLTAQNLYKNSPSQESITKIADLAGSSGSNQQEAASVEGGGETNKERKRWSWG